MAMKDDASPAEIEAMLNQLEQRLQRLRALYEQYFMGIERVPPNGERREVVRMVFQLEQTHIRNTALRFRQRSLTQRFNSYKSYWNRVSKQIEEGTYKRDRQRADRNDERRAGAAQQSDEDGAHIIDLELEEVESLQDFQKELEEMDRAGAFDKKAKLDQIRSQLNAESAPASPSAPAAPAAPSASASSTESQLDDERAAKLARLKQRLKTNTNSSPLPTGGANMDKVREMAAHRERLQQQNQREAAKPKVPARPAQDDQARAVFNQLVEAKRRCNEPTKNLSYDSVQKSMQKQREQLRSSRGARDVDFKVVIKDGKAFLKPVPK